MAIIAVNFPEKVSLANRQAVQIRLTSNLPVAPIQVNSLVISVAGTPLPGQLLSFSYGDFSIQLTFAPQGEDDALTISTPGSLSASEYLNVLAQELAAQVQIFLLFMVSVDGDTVRIVPRGSVNYTFNHFTDAPLDVVQQSSGPGSFAGTPGITLVNEVYDQQTGAYTRRIPHQKPVLSSNEAVIFDLQDDFVLSYETPLPSSIGPGANAVHYCTRNWTKYRIRYAESNGRPPVTLPLTENPDELFVIHGSRGYLTQFSTFWSFWESGMRFQTSLLSPQLVTSQQPNWLYWLGRQDNRTLQYNVDITRESGAVETRLLGFITENIGQITAISTGMRQLGLPEEDPDAITEYTVYLSTIGRTEDVSERFTYQVSYDCEDWERYFLVGNSLGGMDTWRTTGRFQITSEAETKTARRSVDAEDILNSRGEDFDYYRQQRILYSGNIGHVSREDIERLQTLLISTEVKLIDTAKQRFVPILIDPGSVGLTKDGNDLDSLQFGFRLAFEDHALDDVPKLY